MLNIKAFYRLVIVAWCLAFLATPTYAVQQTSFETKCAALAREKGKDGKRLNQLFEMVWSYDLAESPETATYNGFPGSNDNWSDVSLPAVERRKREAKAPMLVLQSISRSKLSPADRLNFDLFKRDTETELESFRFPDEFLAMNQLDGIYAFLPKFFLVVPTKNKKDYEDVIKRLHKIPVLVQQHIVLMKEGLKAKVTYPKLTMKEVPKQILQVIETPLDQSEFLKPFEKMPETVTKEEAERLTAEAKGVLQKQVFPAFRELYTFVKDIYLPGCRETTAWSDLPNGKAWYAFRVKNSTTQTLAPDKIHEIGLSEVARIHKEMEKVKTEAKFKGTLAEFTKYLKNDAQFFYTSPEDLLKGYRDIAKRIDPQLMTLFGKLPRMPYGVKAVPSYGEATGPAAYYEGGSVKGERPGYFVANTYDLKSRPKWGMEALTLHEAVPGHHLQIALQEELTDVPEFRKHGSYTAYEEGWGLYAESLGTALGLYKTAYDRYGALNLEVWRSVRLVVDTGLHAKGWSRQKAIDYFQENTAMALHDIEAEVDRYIVWAGQALAYKTGQLKIKALREQAQKELGDRFDLRAFHDTVLKNGALPLDILDREVNDWIKTRLHASSEGFPRKRVGK